MPPHHPSGRPASRPGPPAACPWPGEPDVPSDDKPRATHVEGPETALRVVVDPALCIGSGICLATAPRHFESAEGHRSRARSDAPVVDESADDAVALCPVEAIGFLTSRPPAPPPAPPGP
ncbi:ferredoxin [Streptomyces microflavus]|uniref:ferredoxin n=1 Tax=Streptomyces microflavus TaxID=1919 RepID=UPI00381AA1C2